MLKYSLYALALVAAITTHGQKSKVPDPAAFAKSITAEDLKKHLYIVAGPEMEGRETATPGQKKAASYIETQFRSLGLLPGNRNGYQQPYPVFEDSVVSAAIEVNGKKFELGKDFTVNPGINHSATLFSGQVIVAGNGIVDSNRNDYAGISATGKVVLVFQSLSSTPAAVSGGGGGSRAVRTFRPYALQEAAAKNGAAALLIVPANSGNNTSRIRSAGSQYVNGYRETIYPNSFMISDSIAAALLGSEYASIREAIKKGDAAPKSISTELMMSFNKVTKRNESSNVIGFLEGTDLKDQYLILTAHYDHLGKRDGNTIYYGADDDGSGTVSIMELAEAFSKAKAAGSGPRRSVIFMTVSGEEKGLWGSAYYSDHPLFPLDKTTADLNIDMIGRIDPKRKQGDSTNYVYVVGDDKLSSDLKPISESINNKFTKLELDYKYNDPKDPERIYFRSDHFNFARKGVPVLFYFNGTHADYHRPSDTPDKIDYTQMAKRAQLVFHTAWEMANRNDMLKRDIPLDIQFMGR